MVKILEHVLVPKHEIISEEEKNSLLQSLKITEQQLPKILSSDPVVKAINAKPGDVLRITRTSPVAGEVVYYRLVVEKGD